MRWSARKRSGVEWSDRCPDVGPWTEAVKRSLITLKALTYAPTGGIVAAVTTSLPERLGGVRNWDYRYCWLRDATFTLLALMQLGYYDEAQAWRDWFVRAVAGSPRQIQIMYGVGGERWLPELIVPWLPGYENSAPVRIGNDASRQFQLDVFGEIADSMFQAYKAGMKPTERGRGLRSVILDYLATAWRQPDEGIWEVRGGPQHFVHSKVMAWVAFDRAAHELEAQAFNEPGERWREIADEIHAEVCERGFDRDLNSFVQAYGSKRLDASLLLIPLVGFLPADRSARPGNASGDRGKTADRRGIRSAVRNRKFRRWPAAQAKELFWRAAFGWSTTTYCKGAMRKLGRFSNVCSRAAMTWACLLKSLIR